MMRRNDRGAPRSQHGGDPKVIALIVVGGCHQLRAGVSTTANPVQVATRPGASELAVVDVHITKAVDEDQSVRLSRNV
ncbi:hypothetical protein [Parafrigoribacterium mesophilum]|uniref:hypothetical protein n=1 Tax=Parafrigoribacterium mesophilum TaxID=433646 RepID=UPI0031FDD42D